MLLVFYEYVVLLFHKLNICFMNFNFMAGRVALFMLYIYVCKIKPNRNMQINIRYLITFFFILFGKITL